MSIKVTTLVWQNFNGSGADLLTMLALADWCDDEGGRLYPSVAAVAKRIRLSESQARRSLHKLIEKNYLKVVKNHDGGFNKETRHYQINVLLLHVPLYKWDKAAKLKKKVASLDDIYGDFDINFNDYGKKETEVF